MRLPFLSKPHENPVVRAYVEGTPRCYSRKTLLDDLRFVVLDTETSGFRVGKDVLLSLGTLTVTGRDLHLDSLREWLIYQPEAQITEAVNIHGILPSETAGGRPEREVLEELLPLITGAVLVGHHVGFDIAMLNAALHKHFHVRLRNPLLDTGIMAMDSLEAFARTGYANQRPPSLDELCAHCAIQAVERHRASGDAFTTAELFLFMYARLRKNLGRLVRVSDLSFLKS